MKDTPMLGTDGKNVDEQMEQQLLETINARGETDEEERSVELLSKLMEQQVIQRFSADFCSLQTPIACKEQSDSFDVSKLVSRELLTAKRWEEYDELLFGKPGCIHGKHFSLTRKPGEKILIFRVFPCIDFESKSVHYETQLLEYAEQENPDGTESQIFFVDEPEDEVELIIVAFPEKSTDVFVNMGILSGSFVKIGKRFVRFARYTDCMAPELKDNHTTHHIEEHDKEQFGLQDGKWYEASSDSNIIIIDYETREPVLRETYYDKDEAIWKTKVKLVPHKSYFIFQIGITSEAYTPSRPLTQLEQGKYFKDGPCGFPHDLIRAVACFEEDASPEAYYHIACIMGAKNDFYNEAVATDYLKRSAEGGFPAAQTNYAVKLLLDEQKQVADADVRQAMDYLRSAVDASFAPAQFLLAYFCETGRWLKKDTKEAVQLYLRAARSQYAPAILRLGAYVQSDREVTLDSIEELCDGRETAYSEYCFANALLGLKYLEVQKNRYCSDDNWLDENRLRGLQILERAAAQGCEEAAYDLALIYDYGTNWVEENKERALEWYLKIAKRTPVVAIRISNMLLDGCGCEQCQSNDRIAFEILFSQKDVEMPDEIKQVVSSNIGWMYMNGRGCGLDYDQAIEHFECAAALGGKNADYYLGCIFEKGLGVVPDLNLAIEYYKAGAALGHQKCQEKLNELCTNSASGTSESDIGEAPFIFVSYSHKDNEVALPIISMISERYRVWFDDGIDPGTEWDENIARHVLDSGYVVALISENYLESEFCKNELRFARSHKKRVLLIYIEDVCLPPGLELRVNQFQAIYWGRYTGSAEFMKKFETTEGISDFDRE